MGDLSNREMFREMRFNVGHGPAQSRLGLARRGAKFPLVGVGEPRGNEFQEIEQVGLLIRGEHPVALEERT